MSAYQIHIDITCFENTRGNIFEQNIHFRRSLEAYIFENAPQKFSSTYVHVKQSQVSGNYTEIVKRNKFF